MPGTDPNDFRPLILSFFTEIAIIEHLLRNRNDRIRPGGMTAGQFGVLSHFIRTGKVSERQSILAWTFEDSDEQMAAKIDALAGRGYLTVVPEGGDRNIAITDAGRGAFANALDEISPEILAIVEGIDMAELQTSFNTLREIRRTLDNLPDR